MNKKIIYLSLLSCLATPAVLANDTSITFVGGVPRIQHEAHIAMVAEDLRFHYVQPDPVPAKAQEHCPPESYFDQGACHFEANWQADHVYTFKNMGPAKNLTIALPFDLPEAPAESDHRGPLLDDPDGIRDMTTSLDGHILNVSQSNVNIQEPVAINRLYWVNVSFAAGQIRQLRHRYRSHAVSSVAGLRYQYLLRTGSTWAGAIGKVNIEFELPPGHGPCAVTNLPYTYDGRFLKVQLSHWKPDRDFEVLFADRSRVLLNTGVYPWGQTLDEVCSDAMVQPYEARLQLADQIEYLYGKPHRERSWALEMGALPMCLSADYFSVLSTEYEGYQPEWGISAISFLPDPDYPHTMQPLLQACLQELRKN